MTIHIVHDGGSKALPDMGVQEDSLLPCFMHSVSESDTKNWYRRYKWRLLLQKMLACHCSFVATAVKCCSRIY
jgi:hypothetical protein